MNWPAADRFLDGLDADSRARLRRLLESPDDVRAATIGRVHLHEGSGDLEEFLIQLEEKEWARRWFVERLRQELP